MHVLLVLRRACAVAALLAITAPASARGGPPFHAGGFRGFGGAGLARGGAWAPAGRRGLPPISGVIHERVGARPTLTVYGRPGGSIRYGAPRLFGHVGTAPRPRIYAAGRAFAGRRGLSRGFAGGLGGGLGYGYGGYDAPGLYGSPGTYGGVGTYGNGGTYGAPGTYGGQGTYGTTATQSLFGARGYAPYRSERPLAARYVEPPLGPSPGAGYDPWDRYADDGAFRASPARILRVGRGASRTPCGCEPRILPYGVGTAY